MTSLIQHSVVIGAGIGGLLAAAALAQHSSRVVILDRDDIADTTEPRSGTPQSRHPHVLLLGGLDALNEWFPGINDDIAADGLFAEYTVTGALDLTWSVQNRTAKGNHQRVLAEIRQAELDLKQIRQTTATAVIRAANNSRSAAKRYELATLSVELAEQNLAVFGESTSSGRVTRNCAASLRAKGIALPAGFEVIDRDIAMGVIAPDVDAAAGQPARE